MIHRSFIAGALGAALLLSSGRPSPALEPATALVAPDATIASLVASVSAARLRATDARLVAFGTRNLFSETLPPRGRGVYAARNWIAAQFREIAKTSGGRMSVALDTFVQPKTSYTPRAVEVSSVVATLRGDEPGGRTYALTSHYDSRNSDGNDAILDAPGADDNGSGTSCVLEAARVMARERFRGTILFVTYDGEEQGLFGSAHHAKTLHDAGAPIAGVLNVDIIGSSVGHGGETSPYDVRLFSEALPAGATPGRVNRLGTENDSPARELARFVKETGERYVPPMRANLIYRADRFLRGGDQESFSERGYAAVRFVEQHENFDHQHQNVRVENGIAYGDLMEYMDFEYLARVTQMNVAALAALALGPAKPEGAEMLARDLAYDTALRWKAVPGAAAYEIVWRPTSEPLWSNVRAVGDVTSYTAIGLSKDDWLFGVRAVDAQGRKSVVAFPDPVR